MEIERERECHVASSTLLVSKEHYRDRFEHVHSSVDAFPISPLMIVTQFAKPVFLE